MELIGEGSPSRSAFVFFVLLTALSSAHAQQPVLVAFDVAQPLKGQPLGEYLVAFVDQTGTMDLAGALEADRERRFSPTRHGHPNFAPSLKPVWLRFDVTNSGSNVVEWELELAHPFMEEVDFYTQEQGGGFKAHRTGISRPVDTRFERRRTFVFPLAIEPHTQHRYYLRILGKPAIGALNAWSHKALEAADRREEFGFGLFYGIIFGLFAYNLFLWQSFRDPPTKWYLLFLIPLTLAYTSFFGYSAIYLWGDYPSLAGVRDIQFFYFASGALYFQFARSFLNATHYIPVLDRVIRGVIYFLSGAMLISFLLPVHIVHLILGWSELSSILLPIAAAIVWRRGYRPARYYLMASVLFVSVVFLLGSWNYGLIHAGPQAFYMAIGMGTAAEIILFSMALADRINLLRQEKERAQYLAEETLRRTAEELECQVDARTLELQRAVEHAQSLARTDELTGVMNRRAFFAAGESELRRLHRNGDSCALAVFDLDYFKAINDTYGHAVGDAALLAVAEQAREVLREVDCIGRLGGEEFALLLPNTNLKEAQTVAERLRRRLTEYRLEVQDLRLGFTASFGIAEATRETVKLSDLLSAADAAMYRAKEEGRNRVVAAV